MNNTQTTDPQDELFDLVDAQGLVIGQATRAECHRRPDLCHRAVYVLVFNHERALYLQKRSSTKDTNPDRWTVSVSGHLELGEDYESAARREIEEELGTSCGELNPLKTWRFLTPVEQERVVFYETVHDGPFTLNQQEISEGRFFSFEELSERFGNPDFPLTPVMRHLLESWVKKGSWPPPVLQGDGLYEVDFRQGETHVD